MHSRPENATRPDVLSGFRTIPDASRRARGPVAVIECFEEIPCDPCHDACRRGAIRAFDDICHLPEVDFDKCNGCGACISVCPGLAIFVVDETWRDGFAVVRLPYEFVPLPAPGDRVAALDRSGKERCPGTVVKVEKTMRHDRTAVIWVEVPRAFSMDARHIRAGGTMLVDGKGRGKLRDTGDEAIVICRCEDVTLGEIRDLIARGYTTMDEIKRITRCGMGPCQGRTCRQLVLAEIARATGKSVASVAPPRFRPPAKPIRLRGATEGDGRG